MAVKKLDRAEIELFLTAIKSNADMLKSLLDTKVILANNVQTTLASLITYGSKIGINAADLILTQNAIKPDVDKLKSDMNALQGTGGTFLGLGSQDADADDIELAFAGDNPKNGDRIMKQVDMGGGKTGWQVWKYDDAKTPKWNAAGQIVEAALIDLSAFMKLDGSNYQGTPLANIVSTAITSGINNRLNDLQGLANKTTFTETKTFSTGQMASSLFYDGANSYLPNQPKATDGWKLKNLVASFEQIANDVPFDYVMSNIVTADGRIGFHIEDRSDQGSNNKLHVYFDMDNAPSTAGRMHDVEKSGWFASNNEWKLSFIGTWEREVAIVVPSDKGKFDDGAGNINFISSADGTTPEKTLIAKAAVDKLATDITTNAVDISNNKIDIATHDASIINNATDIATNKTDIATNTAAIAGKASKDLSGVNVGVAHAGKMIQVKADGTLEFIHQSHSFYGSFDTKALLDAATDHKTKDDVAFVEDDDKFYHYDGSAWVVHVDSGGTGGSSGSTASVFTQNSDKLVANDTTSTAVAHIGNGYKGEQFYGYSAEGDQHYGQLAEGEQFYGLAAAGKQSYGQLAEGDQSYGTGAKGSQSYGDVAAGKQSYGTSAKGSQSYGQNATGAVSMHFSESGVYNKIEFKQNASDGNTMYIYIDESPEISFRELIQKVKSI